MTDRKEFLSFEKFWEITGEKRSHSIALDDVNMLEFDAMYYSEIADEYITKVRLKDKYKERYFSNPRLHENNLLFLDKIHLLHWADWLSIAIINELHPETKNYFFFSTKSNFDFIEPTFVEQDMIFKTKIIFEKRRKKKSEYTFLNVVGNWVFITGELVVVKEQFDILKHYYKKHEDNK